MIFEIFDKILGSKNCQGLELQQFEWGDSIQHWLSSSEHIVSYLSVF
jgi:hypothetical protein